MPTKRVQIIDNKGVIEITETKTEKRVFRESDLLQQKAYFEGLITKGQAGLAKIESLLTDINNAKGA